MTTFDDEFAGLIKRSWYERAPSCWADGHTGPFADYGTGIEEDGTVVYLRRCTKCDRLEELSSYDAKAVTACGLGPVHYNREPDSEADYVRRLIERLESNRWRILRSEHTGTHHSGSKLRVDFIVEAPDPHTWHDQTAIFALECKRHGAAWKDKAAAIWQAIDYTHTNWPGFGRLPVLLSPPPWEPDSFVQHVMGKGRVGEISFETGRWQRNNGSVERSRTALTVRMSGHVLWHETTGIGEGRRWSLIPNKFGSAR